MFLRGMWHPTQLAPAPVRIVVRVRRQRRGRRVLRVAADADPVARRRGQPFELGAPILAVRIVAGHARHLARAAAQQKVARLARGDRAAARVAAAPLLPLPGVRVAREQHLVAARAHAVDPLGARHLAVGRAAGRASRNALLGAKSGSTRGSSTCWRLPPWHASQPMPTSTKCARAEARRAARGSRA